MHHATDAEWSVVVRRQLENLVALFPVLAVLFIPVLLLRHHLYDWMNILPGADAALDAKRAYLNWKFFLVRAVIFFAFFILSGFLLRGYSVRQDKDGNPGFTINMRKIAFVSLPLFGLCLTFAGFDWLMSLNFKWYSTMWGLYIFAGAAGSSMSFLVLVITALRKAGYLKETVTLEHYHIMGKWMLAFCVFWAYIGFSQYMLYLVRKHSGRNALFHPAEYGIVVAPEHPARRRPVLCAIRDFAPAFDQETSASALLYGELDDVHAIARHVHHCPAGPASDRCASQRVGLCSLLSLLARPSDFFTCALWAKLRSFRRAIRA